MFGLNLIAVFSFSNERRPWYSTYLCLVSCSHFNIFHFPCFIHLFSFLISPFPCIFIHFLLVFVIHSLAFNFFDGKMLEFSTVSFYIHGEALILKVRIIGLCAKIGE